MSHRPTHGNCARAHNRRQREGFYDKYIIGTGIDIGCAQRYRSVSYDADLWDLHSTTLRGDATYMDGIADNTYDYVMASHILEHLENPAEALRNWLRITKEGGYLIVCVPERDLFECKKELPSDYNRYHVWYFKADQEEPPVTINLTALISLTLDPHIEIEYIKVCDENWDPYNRPYQKVDPVGEFQIEAVIQKLPVKGKIK